MASVQCGDCKRVEVLRKIKTGSSWIREQRAVGEDLELYNGAVATLVFANADYVRECEKCRQCLSTALKMPNFWWSKACRRTNGYFGCEDTYDEKGHFDGHNTWFRFLVKRMLKVPGPDKKNYTWYKFNVVTRWLPAGQTIAVIFDLKAPIRSKIPEPIFHFEGPPSWDDPYWIHTHLIEEIVRLEDKGVWDIRDLVRETEKTRTSLARPDPKYPWLHDISRHAIHVSETLDLATKTVNSVITHHGEFWADRPKDAQQKVVLKRISDRLRFYDYMLRGLKYRNASNKERLSNEIQLAYNTVAQYDSRISVQIGKVAAIDSAAMRTVAFVTLAFLPATFVSALFSMSFFNYTPASGDTPGKWSVSEEFWVYWVISIPITGITVLLWRVWNKFNSQQSITGEEIKPQDSAKLVFKRLLRRLDKGETIGGLDHKV